MNWKILGWLIRPRNFPLTIAVIVAIGITAVDFLARDFYQAGIAFTLAAITTSLLIERQSYFEPTLEQIHKIRNLNGISAFYSHRDELPSFETECAECEHDVFIVGNIFGRLLAGGFSTLESRLNAGCRVRLLMMNPCPGGTPNPLLRYFCDITNNPISAVIVESHIEQLRKWHSSLSPAKAKLIDVRLYDTLVTVVYASLDGNYPHGKIRIELLPHKFEGYERPSIEIRSGESSKFYKRLQGKYEQLWKESPSIFSNSK
jgi:hypothetical protein